MRKSTSMAACQEIFLISQEIFTEKQDIKNMKLEKFQKSAQPCTQGFCAYCSLRAISAEALGTRLKSALKSSWVRGWIKVTNITIRA